MNSRRNSFGGFAMRTKTVPMIAEIVQHAILDNINIHEEVNSSLVKDSPTLLNSRQGVHTFVENTDASFKKRFIFIFKKYKW